MSYAELQVTSNYRFLEGGSHPDELVETAAALGHAAVAITDRNTLAGVVRAHQAAKRAGIRLVVGCRLDFTDRPSLLCYPTDRAAYARLSQLLTLGKRRAPKGECRLFAADLAAYAEGQILAILPPDRPDPDFAERVARDAAEFTGHYYLAAQHLYRGDDAARLAWLDRLARRHGVRLLATNDVLYHAPERRVLQDVLACIRLKCTIDAAGLRLLAHAERHVKSTAEMSRLFRKFPEALEASSEVSERCRFSLEELRYEYPDETHQGRSAQEELALRVEAGLTGRYGDTPPPKVTAQVAHELALISELKYAPYFLTVHDIVSFARSQKILCQGRGSAANSVVCYVLGITSVDPVKGELLFERFISAARNEPPDIDVDFAHERREEVIQHIYRTYGRERTGIAATVICYRMRSAIREVGKVMGLSVDAVAAISGLIWGWGSDALPEERVREAGLDPADPRLARTLALARELVGFPRHLSQHVGGFVITRGLLADLVPICNAAMPERTNIEWDKDDLDALGILKIDVLGLGMLTCIDKGLALLEQHYGVRLDLATVPPEVPEVYDMLCEADTIGVFQIESRAQMTMLPRLRPRAFYDLVIEVAIVRPGPIQGDMVHPYLRRRQGKEQPDYPSKALEQVLSKTLGVPLFQEQAMKIAIVAAGFTPAEADELRRAMATFKRVDRIRFFRDRLIEGMVGNAYERDFAERCFKQIEGFGTYGFPESHAASFALLVYVSAWLKWRHPDVFAAALLNSQPMGFYAPAQIVRDAAAHGVEIRPVDVNHSDWDCTLEEGDDNATPPKPVIPAFSPVIPAKAGIHVPPSAPTVCERGAGGTTWIPAFAGMTREGAGMTREGAGMTREGGTAEKGAVPRKALRLGLRLVKGLGEKEALRLVEQRGAFYRTPQDLARRGGLDRAALENLARADAFRSMGLDRRAALWAVKALGEAPLPLFAALDGPLAAEPAVTLPQMPPGEHVAEDYGSTGLSLKRHPVAFLRDGLKVRGILPCAALAKIRDGRRVEVAGLVLVRQRPGTASGVIFMTLEDETSIANIVVWPALFERFRPVVMAGGLIAARGVVQKEGIVIHVIADRLIDLTAELTHLDTPFPVPHARADEVRHPGHDQRPLKARSRDFH
jgi:error-prone DNA polymerase